jgi:exodeoxyribonuclease (lambda-induced)
MTKIYNCEQKSEEWYKCRLGKLTASVAYTIATAGKGLDTLCLEKATEILTGIIPEGFTSEAMQHGNEYESEARNIYELETGNVVKQVGFVEDNEFVGVSPDGLIGDDGLIEIKCPTDKTYTQYLIDMIVKPEYYAQMQMQMLITKRCWCDYVVYNPHFEKSIIIQRVYPDKEYMEKIGSGLGLGMRKIQEIVKTAKANMELKNE